MPFCRLPFKVRVGQVKMDFLPSVPLGLRVLLQVTLGSYATCLILVFSTLSDPLEKMYNASMINHYGIEADKQLFAYIVGLISAAKLIGSIFCLMYFYPKLDTLGRRAMAVHVPFALAIIASGLQILSKVLVSVELFFLAELFVGAAFPLMNYAAIMYLSECAPTRIRGAVTLFLSSVGLFAWILMSFISKPNWWGNSEQWHYISIMCALMATTHFLVGCLYPESPKFLMYREKRKEAMESVERFHGKDTDVDTVIGEIERELHHPLDEAVTLWKVWEDTQYRDAFLCVFLFDVSNQISPALIDINFSVKVRKSFGFSVDDAMNLRIISALAFSPLYFLGAYLVEKLGRRFIMYTGWTLSLTLCILMASGQFLVDAGKTGPATIAIGWVLQFCANLWSNCGYGNMALLMVSELCVPSIRTTVAQASALLCMVLQMIIFTTYPALTASIGGWYYVPMFIYILVVFWHLSRRLPETRRLSVESIITGMENTVRSRTATAVSRPGSGERDPLLQERRDSGHIY